MDELIKELRIYANDETDEIRFKAADAIEQLIEECDAYRKAMTDEELAGLLTSVAKKSAEKLCESMKTVDVDLSNCDFDILYKAHLDWLKQEVESNDS